MITSTSNSQVRGLVQLKKKAKERSARGVFPVEGIKMLLEAPLSRIEKVYMSQGFEQRAADDPRVRAVLDQTEHETLSDTVFAYVSDTKTPQGVLCLVRMQACREEDLLRGPDNAEPLCMVLENVQDPGNLGTIVRTAEGAGVSGILMSSDTADIYNPKVIRSTMGSIYRVPFMYTADLAGTLRRWQSRGIRLYAAHLKGTGSYDREDYRAASAFLIGNESRGLTDGTASLADRYVRIPMLGQVESLNAAVAGAVLMFEAARQRRG